MTVQHVNGNAQSGFPDRFSLFEALARHWLIALLIIVAFIAAGIGYNKVAPQQYQATAEIIVEDPRADTLLSVASNEGRSNMSSERNLADQVQILESGEVAQAASDLLQNEVSPEFILAHRAVRGSATSNLIEVDFTADDPQLASDGSNALVAAYLDVSQGRIEATASVALTRVDALQEALDRELQEIRQRIEEAIANDAARQELNAQMDQALEQLNTLRFQRQDAVPGSEQRALINSQIDELMRDFAGWETVLRVERQNSELAQLLAEQEAAIAERAALTGRRNQIAVDAELAAGGVTLVSPAPVPNETSGISPRIILAVMAMLGSAVAIAVAYYLSLRRQIITDRAVPERILGAPLLAVVPEFDTEGSLTDLPVSAATDSLAAEAFRFASAAIEIRASAYGARSVVISSAKASTGTTTTVANTAIAAAYAGHRVAVVDADFDDQALSRLFNLERQAGMAEIVNGKINVEHALQRISVGDQHSISVLQRGQMPVDPSSFFHQAATKIVFRYVVESFDLVLIDSPSLIRVAYVSTLARLADAAVLVVEHGSSMEALGEAANRLELVGTPLLGYIYTKAPIRAAGQYRGPQPTRKVEEEPEELEMTLGGATRWFR